MANDNRDRLRQAAQHIKQGDQKSAQAILRDLLKAMPNDADAWYLNSFASSDVNWQIKSLERVLLIAPDHEKAKARLNKLRGSDAPQPTPASQPTRASVTAKVPAPTAPSSRPMLVVGSLVCLVVVILGVNVFLSSRGNSYETQPIAAAPSATLVIVTRKPTEDLPTETSTAPATIINPTFVPTSIRPPTVTPTETQMEISISLPAPARPTDISGVGGGTGRILYKDLSVHPNVFKMVDVRDGTTTDLSLPRDVDEAVLSPDGLHIMVKKWTACMGFEPVNPHDPCIGFANADGSSLTMLPNFPKAYDPVLSPDNRQVAFVAAKNNNHSHLWVANVDGSNVRQLTNYPTGMGEVEEPAWSPDGRYIVYALQHTSTNLRVIAADGTGDRVLIEQGWSPSWSPDGRFLAYIGWTGIAGSELFVANADGTNAHAITAIRPRANGFIAPDSPAWSPDGTFIAYTLGGTYYMIRADGSQPPTPIVEVGVYPLHKPSWQALPASSSVIVVPTITPTATASPTSALTATSWTAAIQQWTPTLNVSPQPHVLATPTLVVTSVPLPGPEWGGGTGRILYNINRVDYWRTFHSINLHDGSISDVTLPHENFDAQWLSDGLQLLVRMPQNHIVCPSEMVQCAGFMGADSLTMNMILDLPDAHEIVPSPDMRLIVYTQRGEDGSAELWIANIDGTNASLLTQAPPDKAGISSPTWSPDGRFIAYALGNSFTPPEIRVISADGSGDRLLTKDATMPAWSPDGSLVAAIGTLPERWGELIVVDPNGQNRRQIYFDPENKTDPQPPAWSPDGTLIAFARYHRLYVASVDGSRPPTLVLQTELIPLGRLSWQPLPSTAVVTATPSLTPTATLRPEEIFTTKVDLRVNVSAQLQSVGDYIGAGYGDAQGNIILQGTDELVIDKGFVGISFVNTTPSGGEWRFMFAAPDLEIGHTYKSLGELGQIPRIEIGSSGRGCNKVDGEFTFEQVEPNIVVRFVQYCEGQTEKTLSGVITFQPLPSLTATPTPTSTITPTPTVTPTATPTLNPENEVIITAGTGYSSAQMHSDPDEYIGRNYMDTEGNITLEGTGDVDGVEGRLLINLRLEDDQWTFIFYAPQLELGRTYDVIGGYGSGEVASMTVSSPGKACDTIGEFTIERVTPDIVVDFVQACNTDPDRKLSGVVTFRPD